MQNEAQDDLGDSFWSRFLESKVIDQKGIYGCVLWAGQYQRNGYGVFIHRRRTYLAHRLSYRYHFNRCRPIKEGMLVLHSCHNRACINPLHLREGNGSQNNVDMWAAGRHPSYKLGPEKRRQLLQLILSGLNVPEACRRFGVNRNYFCDHKRLVRLGLRSPLVTTEV